MSYDIEFGVKVADADGLIAKIGEPEFSSPTYNIGTMLRKCMDWDFKQSKWYKVTDVLPNIERGLHEITFNEKAYRKYNASNGWGDTNSAKNEKLAEQLVICAGNICTSEAPECEYRQYGTFECQGRLMLDAADALCGKEAEDGVHTADMD